MKKFEYKPEILTVSGNYFYFDDVQNSDYTIEDIAHALSHIGRYTGHTKIFYSVAEHAVRASYIVPSEHALAALMHDSSEAFLGDIASPLKAMLIEYKMIEEYVEEEIFKKFGLPFPMHSEIKKADLIMLATEKRDLMPATKVQWDVLKGVIPLDQEIVPVNSSIAKMIFLRRFKELKGERRESNTFTELVENVMWQVRKEAVNCRGCQ
jgi:hypothetical protein